MIVFFCLQRKEENPMKKIRSIFVMALLILTVSFSGCVEKSQINIVEIKNMAYQPSTIAVPAGTTITWINKDPMDHTVTATDGSFNDTGEMIWKYRAPAGINGWPAVAGDTILWPAGVGGTPSLIAFKLGAKGGSPQSMITEPKEGAILPAGNITVSVSVKNFNLSNKFGQANVTGEGHIHYFKDATAPTKPGKPAVTASGTWTNTVNKNYTWINVTPGMHNFSVELVNNDHTPLSPPMVDKITITAVIETTAKDEAKAPASSGTATGTLKANSQNITIDLTARNIAFDKSTITVPAGARVTVNFDNQDSGIPHNFAVYESQTIKTIIFQGEVITGPKKIAYIFDAPSKPGTYFFRCDIHPTTMTGQFIVS
jgi:plastocyanin